MQQSVMHEFGFRAVDIPGYLVMGFCGPYRKDMANNRFIVYYRLEYLKVHTLGCVRNNEARNDTQSCALYSDTPRREGGRGTVPCSLPPLANLFVIKRLIN